MNVFLDPFRFIYTAPETAPLICQLSTGVATFQFTEPGTPGIVTSNNNVHGRWSNDSYDRGVLSASWAWSKQDGSKTLGVTYAHNPWASNPPTKQPGPPVNSPPIHMRIEEGVSIFGGSSLIARMYPSYTNNTVGGFHIETDSSIDYVVAYRLRSVVNGTIKIEKYRVVYDETLDQSLIVDMPLVDTVEYIDNVGEVRPTTELRYPPGTAKTAIGYLAESNIILTPNKAGTKTIFFCDIKNANGDYDVDYQILELTDDGVTFEINTHSVFYGGQVIVDPGSVSSVASGVQNLRDDVSIDPCGTTTSTGVATRTGPGQLLNTDESDHKITEFLLGASYSKITDEVLIAKYIISLQGSNEIETYGYDVNQTDTYSPTGNSKSGTDVLSITREENKIRRNYHRITINNDIILTAETYNFRTSALTRYYGQDEDNSTIVSSEDSRNVEIDHFMIFDLSSKMIGWDVRDRVWVGSYNGPVEPGLFNTHHQWVGTLTDRHYSEIYVNGTVTNVYDNESGQPYTAAEQARGLTRGASTCVSSTFPDCSTQCDNGPYHTEIESNYTGLL